jgi:hypothetical protein
LIFSVIVFIFNLPPCATRGNHLNNVAVLNRQERGERISIQLLQAGKMFGNNELLTIRLMIAKFL